MHTGADSTSARYRPSLSFSACVRSLTRVSKISSDRVRPAKATSLSLVRAATVAVDRTSDVMKNCSDSTFSIGSRPENGPCPFIAKDKAVTETINAATAVPCGPDRKAIHNNIGNGRK